MANKPQPIIIEPKDFKAFLAARMGALNLTVAGLAEELGISRTAAYAMLSGEMLPSKKMLDKVGLEIVYRLADPKGKK